MEIKSNLVCSGQAIKLWNYYQTNKYLSTDWYWNGSKWSPPMSPSSIVEQIK